MSFASSFVSSSVGVNSNGKVAIDWARSSSDFGPRTSTVGGSSLMPLTRTSPVYSSLTGSKRSVRRWTVTGIVRFGSTNSTRMPGGTLRAAPSMRTTSAKVLSLVRSSEITYMIRRLDLAAVELLAELAHADAWAGERHVRFRSRRQFQVEEIALRRRELDDDRNLHVIERLVRPAMHVEPDRGGQARRDAQLDDEMTHILRREQRAGETLHGVPQEAFRSSDGACKRSTSRLARFSRGTGSKRPA